MPVFLQIPASLTIAARMAALQFIPAPWRDWLFVLGGLCLFGLALLQLNKYALSAFGAIDSGDLAGITRRRRDDGQQSAQPTRRGTTNRKDRVKEIQNS